MIKKLEVKEIVEIKLNHIQSILDNIHQDNILSQIARIYVRIMIAKGIIYSNTVLIIQHNDLTNSLSNLSPLHLCHGFLLLEAHPTIFQRVFWY